MKKFTSVLAGVAAIAFSANAADINPTEITVANNSFEDAYSDESFTSDENATNPKGFKVTLGWEENSTSGAYFTYCPYSNAHNNDEALKAEDGGWYARLLVTDGQLEPGTYISQEVEREGAGVYALTAKVCVSRNSTKGGLTADNYGFLYIGDNNSDMDDPAQEGLLLINETNDYDTDGNPIQWTANKYKTVVFNSQAKRGGITIAFGIYPTSAPMSKGWLEIDNVKVEYFGSDVTVEEVGEYLAVNAVEEASYVNNKIYNLQGIEIKDASAPGLYIQNGKKFIVR